MTPGPVGLDSSPDIRVLLFEKQTASRLTTSGPLTVRSLPDGAQARFAEAADLEVAWFHGRIAVGEHVFSGTVEIAPADHQAGLDGASYRGRLSLVPTPDEEGFQVVNIVPLESYLAGVVGAEMPAYWEASALESQAIASRTYAMYHVRRYGPGRTYDVRKTEGYQVYRGVGAETARVWEAVEATRGIVLTTGDASGDEGEDVAVFPAYFCSACGGHTEAAWRVFGVGEIAPLGGVRCPWCRQTSRPSVFEWSAVRLKVEDVWKRLRTHYPSLERLGGLEAIEPMEISRYDDFVRLTKVNLIGRNGQRQWLEAENLRLAVDPTGRTLRSSAFAVRREGEVFVFEQGRGFGHAVGMCQYGALGMARAGKTAAEILAWYYPGSRQVRLY